MTERFTLPGGGQACVLQRPETPSTDRRVLILVHSPPFDDRGSEPLLHLAASLNFATVRIDLTGCGESPGATRFFSHERDADDLAACVRHLREERCLEVAGIVGLGGGGTAYADLRLEPLADEL
jgi:pimeloyl-ACP methyl ester carboxylesterase